MSSNEEPLNFFYYSQKIEQVYMNVHYKQFPNF